MLKLHCSDLWDVITGLSGASAHRHAAVAYVTDDSALRFEEGDTLIVDASPGAVRMGLTSAKLLKKAFDDGAEVFSCPGLHAKILVLDRTAVIGSANISQSSKDLLEAAVVTDNPSLVSAARNVVAQLKLKSDRLDEKALQALLRIRVIRHGFPKSRRKSRPPAVKAASGNTWLTGTYDLDTEKYKDEERRAERGLDEARKRLSRPSSDAEWIRFSKNTNIANRANEGDWLIQMYGPRLGGNVFRVYRRAPILRKQKEPNCVRIYIEHFKNAESDGLKWSTFHKIARQAGIPENRMRRQSMGMLADPKVDALESFWKLALSRAPRKKK
jgi:hypothetical protein